VARSVEKLPVAGKVLAAFGGGDLMVHFKQISIFEVQPTPQTVTVP
jgi:hypothetical protein